MNIDFRKKNLVQYYRIRRIEWNKPQTSLSHLEKKSYSVNCPEFREKISFFVIFLRKNGNFEEIKRPRTIKRRTKIVENEISHLMAATRVSWKAYFSRYFLVMLNIGRHSWEKIDKIHIFFPNFIH